MSGPVRTRGLVLRRIPYSDSSQIVWVFGRDEGIMSLLAKGAMRISRRSSSFPAPFDLCGWYDVVYRRRRGDLHLATEARLVEGFDHLRSRLDRYVDACLAVESMLAMFQPHDAHPGFLRGALSYFKLLAVAHGRRALRLHFHSQLLTAGGVGPRWRHCVECGVEVREPRAVRIPTGVVCEKCRRATDERAAPEVLAYLADEQQTPWGHIPNLRVGVEILAPAWGLVRRTLVQQLERPLKTLKYLT